MARSDVLSDVVTFALGGGLAAVIAASIKAYTSVRSGIRAGDRETIEGIVNDRRLAREELEAARIVARAEIATMRHDLHYYEWITHQYRRQLLEANLTPKPPLPVPPSQQDGSENLPWGQP